MNGINTISPQSLDSLLNREGPATLIDVRTPAEYRAGHAKGAISIPLDDLQPEKLSGLLGDKRLGHEQPLFLTCQSGIRAGKAAERLKAAGFTNLFLLQGGTQAWNRAGLPMQRCGSAMSLERQVQIVIGMLLVLKVFFGFTVNELFFAAIPIIGAGLIVAGITRWCGMARLIAMMPWNQGTDCSKQVTI
ncbi:MAG: rhodanese-like domain-containing protein [Gammaproteobacteria bacterium]|nr:rhodanese-like domain-containing protein [Gammaproteobacteria bacterium]